MNDATIRGRGIIFFSVFIYLVLSLVYNVAGEQTVGWYVFYQCLNLSLISIGCYVIYLNLHLSILLFSVSSLGFYAFLQEIAYIVAYVLSIDSGNSVLRYSSLISITLSLIISLFIVTISKLFYSKQ